MLEDPRSDLRRDPAGRTDGGVCGRLVRWSFATPRRFFLVLLVALGVPIIVSFVVFEAPLLAWTNAALDDGRSNDVIALLCGLLLASDVLLPIPSSVVATVAASVLDATRAIAAIGLGSTASATIGWALGRFLRGAALDRFVDADALSRADASFTRWGLWAYACTRTVPILAEEFAILAGVHRLAFWHRFLPLTVAASLPMAIFYVVAVRTLGLTRDEEPSFLALLLVASVLPIAGLVAMRWRRGE